MAGFKCNVLPFILLLHTFFTDIQSHVHLDNKYISIDWSHGDKLPVIILDALTGETKETWKGVCKDIPLRTQRRVYIYFVRNDGDIRWEETFDIDGLADLEKFITDMKIERASLVGHNIGGLTVMKFALKNPDKVESIFVEDIAPKLPKESSIHVPEHLKFLMNGLSAIPSNVDEETAKKILISYFKTTIGGELVQQLFKKFPLKRRDDMWEWKGDLEVFAKAIEDIDSYVGKMEGLYDGRAFFIYGKDSPFKVNEEKGDIRRLFPNAGFFEVDGADYMVDYQSHVFIDTLVKFLNGKEAECNTKEEKCDFTESMYLDFP